MVPTLKKDLTQEAEADQDLVIEIQDLLLNLLDHVLQEDPKDPKDLKDLHLSTLKLPTILQRVKKLREKRKS